MELEWEEHRETGRKIIKMGEIGRTALLKMVPSRRNAFLKVVDASRAALLKMVDASRATFLEMVNTHRTAHLKMPALPVALNERLDVGDRPGRGGIREVISQ